jgi:hypothetical protein
VYPGGAEDRGLGVTWVIKDLLIQFTEHLKFYTRFKLSFLGFVGMIK